LPDQPVPQAQKVLLPQEQRVLVLQVQQVLREQQVWVQPALL
jgi:hypothetical protein